MIPVVPCNSPSSRYHHCLTSARYDPTSDTYFFFYQWHPQHINWGNISWGQATSKDLITFTDKIGWQDSEALALGPTGFGNYNGLGIFSGTAQPVNLHGEVDGTLLLMYTSVSWLPTSWSITYHPHTESQSLAISKDGLQVVTPIRLPWRPNSDYTNSLI